MLIRPCILRGETLFVGVPTYYGVQGGVAIGLQAFDPSMPSRPYHMTERPQSLGEEIANTVSHGMALAAAIAAVPFLIFPARPVGIGHVVGGAVFTVTLVLLYLTSTLYHALPAGRAKWIFLKLDHCAIYRFMAGSYTR